MTSTVNYGFSTPRHIFEKLKRDAEKLRADVSPDNVFNFAVTAWSLIDWIKNGPALSDSRLETARKRLARHPMLQVCRDLANASKHFSLTYRPTVENVRAVPGAVYGESVYGESVYGGMPSVLMTIGDQHYSVSEVVASVLTLYEELFENHNL